MAAAPFPAPMTSVRPLGEGCGKNCGMHFSALTASTALEYKSSKSWREFIAGMSWDIDEGHETMQAKSLPASSDTDCLGILCFGNFVIRHDFDRAAQCRVIHAAQAVGGASIHQFLHIGSIRQ